MNDVDDYTAIAARQADLTADDDWARELPDYVEEWNEWWWLNTFAFKPIRSQGAYRPDDLLDAA